MQATLRARGRCSQSPARHTFAVNQLMRTGALGCLCGCGQNWMRHPGALAMHGHEAGMMMCRAPAGQGPGGGPMRGRRQQPRVRDAARRRHARLQAGRVRARHLPPTVTLARCQGRALPVERSSELQGANVRAACTHEHKAMAAHSCGKLALRCVIAATPTCVCVERWVAAVGKCLCILSGARTQNPVSGLGLAATCFPAGGTAQQRISVA